jgi:hypothetical protein
MPTDNDVRVDCVECGTSAHSDWVVRLPDGPSCQWPFLWLTETIEDFAVRESAWMLGHPRTAARGFPYLGGSEWQTSRRVRYPRRADEAR